MSPQGHIEKAMAYAAKADSETVSLGDRVMYAQLAQSHAEIAQAKLAAK